MIFKNPDIGAGYRKMMDAKEHFRSQKEIIRDLKEELSPVDEESFATHLSRLVMEMDSRAENPLFEHFQSPLKLITYLIDLYYSIPDRSGTEQVTDERWQRIAILLDEVEMNYFISVGLPNSVTAMRKYTNSAARSRTVIIKYVSQESYHYLSKTQNTVLIIFA